MARIALDAMGGDLAPEAPIAGALQALLELDRSHKIQLVGRTEVIEATLTRLLAGDLAAAGAQRARLEIIEAPDVVEMADKPTVVRKKPNSSMAVGLRLQTDGRSDGFVSAGNTGAQMAGSFFILGLHQGMTRPAIATLFPTAGQPIVVIDSGANVDCTSTELVQFARLGAVYAEAVLGRKNPSVGLLSIGEEAEKGNAVVKETNGLLAASGLNFQGNVEGRDIPRGASDRGPIDVVVCDGFVGNVLVKFYEAVTPTLLKMLRGVVDLDAATVQRAFGSLDYSEHGGAPLLGVKGVSIIAHGRSDARAIKNAIRVAVQAAESGMNETIGRRLAESEEVKA
ncbi:MAG TPA: phosphate acyltransferase PlsX [Gemmatimonadaceae bacterium]|nr:phosphate acyltransferase PlsX [Gemmatimonadaceae bacterium]